MVFGLTACVGNALQPIPQEVARGPKKAQDPEGTPGGEIKPTEAPGERAARGRGIAAKSRVCDTMWPFCQHETSEAGNVDL